jgi:hypothetical protein
MKINVIQLINNLVGTTNDIDEVIEDLFPGLTTEDLNEDEKEVIKKAIKKCENCNAWFEVDENFIDIHDFIKCDECLDIINQED